MKNKQIFGDLHEVILLKTSRKILFLRLFFDTFSTSRIFRRVLDIFDSDQVG